MRLMDLLSKKNVVGYGHGIKSTSGIVTGGHCLIVFVKRKVPLSSLGKKDRIPMVINNEITDVVEVKDIKALSIDRTKRKRPSPCGMSIGHYKITAGTQGLLVRTRSGVNILSNNHVLANSNDADTGDSIYQPGVYDGGTEKDKIGTLSDFIPIRWLDDVDCSISNGVVRFLNFISRVFRRASRFGVHREFSTEGINFVDAALAIPDKLEYVSSNIIGIGNTEGTNYNVDVGCKIKKSGRTSGVTSSNVISKDGVIKVGYGEHTAIFVDQYLTGPLLSPGDSGSAVLDDDNRVVGLGFAGSSVVGVVNKMSHVMSLLDIEEVL